MFKPRSILLTCLLTGTAACQCPAQELASPKLSLEYLADRLDLFHKDYPVFVEFDSAGNSFVTPGEIYAKSLNSTPPMDTDCTTDPFGSLTCVECTYKPQGIGDWAGWYFLNGVLTGSERTPLENWGTAANAGVDLTGATQLTFYARGANGGEKVNFFCGGVGWPAKAYKDSNDTVSTSYLTLNKTWTKYTINLLGHNLSYVLGGFGWDASQAEDPNTITFYLAGISYNKQTLYEPGFTTSYETTIPTDGSQAFDLTNENVGYIYDNAVANIALIGGSDMDHATEISKAFIYVPGHDRYYTDGRIRSAYMGGQLILPPGWRPNYKVGCPRTPGWYQGSTWFEDGSQMGADTGNTAWTMIALLSYYEHTHDATALSEATTLGDWVVKNCKANDKVGGYTGGYWGDDGDTTKLTYRATEHSIDLYAAFSRLAKDTGDSGWLADAAWARAFVLSMWDPQGGKFWTGTKAGGQTLNTANVPTDIQAWAILSLKLAGTAYTAALAYASTHNRCSNGGYAFNGDATGDWFEGTCQIAAAYNYIGDVSMAKDLIDFVELNGQSAVTGGVWAASIDFLPTGDSSPPTYTSPIYYFRRKHIGAIAWLAIAQEGINPFWY